ncbi:MAG: SelB C-terminal domain-containing protein, partial [Anaerolineaceae bacterium]|nr:SelB C-terminal domain-containing protein [Anaerolineaceae bacterium]
MPQTREHLAILDILQVESGVIALTKTDLIDDPEWLNLVVDDIRQAFQGTVLEKAPMVPVSSKNGMGIDDLVMALMNCLSGHPQRPDLGRPRLFIDRVFTMAGFGTIVTGTLIDGRLSIGDEVIILPSGLRGRIRGLQSHKKSAETAFPGSRTAVNITGFEVSQINRGDVLAIPGKYEPSKRIDIHFGLLQDISTSLRHNTDVKLFLGSSEVFARLRLLGAEELKPGQEGWLQLELKHPVVAVRGDRYILRRPSPAETLGGGIVVNPHPGKRHKRFFSGIIDQLEILRKGSPSEILYRASVVSGPGSIRDLEAISGLSGEQFQLALLDLIENGMLVVLGEGAISAKSNVVVISRQQWNSEGSKLKEILEKHHQIYPLRRGIPREELKSKLKMTTKIFNLSINMWLSDDLIDEIDTVIKLSGHEIKFTKEQQKVVDDLMLDFSKSPYSPPTIKDCIERIGDELFSALVELKLLKLVSSEVAYRNDVYEEIIQNVKEIIRRDGEIKVSQFRDYLKTSRRYALAFLEHLDNEEITIRDGDIRRLKRG